MVIIQFYKKNKEKTVVMFLNNLSSHHSIYFTRNAEFHGIWLIFNAPYTPRLNPAETPIKEIRRFLSLHFLINTYEIKEKVVYAPKIIRKGKFSYSFDAIARNGEKAVFIKVFKDATNTFRPAELLKLRKAVELANKYYNSHVLVFSKRRFCDEATNEAAWDDSLSLVEIERLKF